MAGVTASCVLLACLVIGWTRAQDLSSEQRSRIDSTVKEVMRCANIPSLSLTYVSLDSRVRLLRAYGSQEVNGQRRDAETSSVYCIGGATQAFTAVLLAKLLHLNKSSTWDWDTPVQDIVGHKLALPTRFISQNLNLKDILAMRSGLAGMDIVPLVKPYSQDTLVWTLKYAPRVAGFRNQFVYNEVLFSLLEEVVKHLGGDTWQNLLDKHILKPLDMTRTVIAGNKSFSSPTFVRGAVNSGNRPLYLDDAAYSGLELVAPAASLCTSAEDMSRWLHFVLSEGQKGHDLIVRKEDLEATYEAVQSRGQGGPVQQGYSKPALQEPYTRTHNSLGWINGLYRGHSFVSQDGSLPGYQSLTTIIPAKKVGVFAVFNSDHNEKRFAAKVLLNVLGLDYLLQGDSWLTAGNACSVLDNLYRAATKSSATEGRRAHKKSATSQRPLEEYVGRYANLAFGDIYVKLNDSQDSSLTLLYGRAVFSLDPVSNTTFQLIAKAGSLWYITNADFYRDKQRIFAEFTFNIRDPDHRIVTVSIDGFDKHYVPEFSTVLRVNDDEDDECYNKYRCCAPTMATYQSLILLFCVLVSFR